MSFVDSTWLDLSFFIQSDNLWGLLGLSSPLTSDVIIDVDECLHFAFGFLYVSRPFCFFVPALILLLNSCFFIPAWFFLKQMFSSVISLFLKLLISALFRPYHSVLTYQNRLQVYINSWDILKCYSYEALFPLSPFRDIIFTHI